MVKLAQIRGVLVRELYSAARSARGKIMRINLALYVVYRYCRHV